ncbi:MAG TPA: hypothetical protein PKW24_02650 [Clostridiales bacterium]|nr:hypothetical protein [Clostridiales bacterium]HRT81726.1 hypothetical protein [Oscillospiraceae bacterium]
MDLLGSIFGSFGDIVAHLGDIKDILQLLNNILESDVVVLITKLAGPVVDIILSLIG